MAFIDNIVKFHTFSKSTVRNDLTLGEAVNPSGHTVTSTQVRTDDIPAFIYSWQESKQDALTWASKNIDAFVRHNDILYYGKGFNQGFETPKCLRYVSLQETNGYGSQLSKTQDGKTIAVEGHWEDFSVSDKSYLYNAESKRVIAVHKDAKICYVHTDNNASTDSNQNSAFVKKADGSFLTHFVAPTDQIIGGQPSVGYSLCLFNLGIQNTAFTEGEKIGDNNYISNCYAGLIHFMDTRSEKADSSKNYEA